MKHASLFAPVAAAWNLLLDYPLPAAWRKTEPAPPELTLIMLPLIGFAAGLAVLLAVEVGALVVTRTGAALLFALLATLLLDTKDSGRGLSMTVAAATALVSRRVPLTGLLPQLRAPRIDAMSGTVPAAVLILTELFKVGAFFMLARSGAAMTLPLVLVLAFAVQGTLMTLPELGTETPFLEVPPATVGRIWIAAGFFALFSALHLPLASLVAFGAAGAGAYALRGWTERTYGGITAEMITLAGALAELAVLVFAVLLAA